MTAAVDHRESGRVARLRQHPRRESHRQVGDARRAATKRTVAKASPTRAKRSVSARSTVESKRSASARSTVGSKRPGSPRRAVTAKRSDSARNRVGSHPSGSARRGSVSRSTTNTARNTVTKTTPREHRQERRGPHRTESAPRLVVHRTRRISPRVLSVAFFACFFAILFSAVWLQSLRAGADRNIDVLDQQIRSAAESYLELRAELAEKETPALMMQKARDLGMIDPGPVAPLAVPDDSDVQPVIADGAAGA